jgi:hypothetical protein
VRAAVWLPPKDIAHDPPLPHTDIICTSAVSLPAVRVLDKRKPGGGSPLQMMRRHFGAVFADHVPAGSDCGFCLFEPHVIDCLVSGAKYANPSLQV